MLVPRTPVSLSLSLTQFHPYCIFIANSFYYNIFWLHVEYLFFFFPLFGALIPFCIFGPISVLCAPFFPLPAFTYPGYIKLVWSVGKDESQTNFQLETTKSANHQQNISCRFHCPILHISWRHFRRAARATNRLSNIYTHSHTRVLLYSNWRNHFPLFGIFLSVCVFILASTAAV